MTDRLKEALSDPKRRSSMERRFWMKVEKAGIDECWPWIAKSKANFGYGAINVGRKYGVFKSNRVAYFLCKGDIPAGLFVLHSCDNPKCCNPNHLRLGSKLDNTKDAMIRNRLKPPPVHYGESHHNTKLSDQDISNILEDERVYKEIAEQYGVSYKTIYRIKKHKTWKNHEDIRKRD